MEAGNQFILNYSETSGFISLKIALSSKLFNDFVLIKIVLQFFFCGY